MPQSPHTKRSRIRRQEALSITDSTSNVAHADINNISKTSSISPLTIQSNVNMTPLDNQQRERTTEDESFHKNATKLQSFILSGKSDQQHGNNNVTEATSRSIIYHSLDDQTYPATPGIRNNVDSVKVKNDCNLNVENEKSSQTDKYISVVTTNTRLARPIIVDDNISDEISYMSYVSSLSEDEIPIVFSDQLHDDNPSVQKMRRYHHQTPSDTHGKEGYSIENEKKRPPEICTKFNYNQIGRMVSVESERSKVGELMNFNQKQHRQGSTVISLESHNSWKQIQRRSRKPSLNPNGAALSENLDSLSCTQFNRQRRRLRHKPGFDSGRPSGTFPMRKVNSSTSVHSMFTSLTDLKDEAFSVASASVACSTKSIVVNGRVMNDIQHREQRPRTAPHTTGVSRSIEGNDLDYTIGHKSVTLDQLDELKATMNVDMLRHEVEGGRKKRRRRVKDEMKYMVGKIVPSPLKGMKAALTKRKRYNLERSNGRLT